MTAKTKKVYMYVDSACLVPVTSKQ